MNCDLFMQNIDAFFDGELSETTISAFEEHKNSCTECNLLFESYKEMMNGLNTMNEIEIPFPINLHDSIMKSVNEVAEQGTKSESNVSNVIDITSYINENEKDAKSTKSKFFDSYKKNTLVAGLLSVFVATGAYKTYDSYQNSLVADEGMLTIDLADDNSVADSNAQDNTTSIDAQETKDNTTNENTTQVGDSTNLATTTQEPDKANIVNETTSTNATSDKVENAPLSKEVSTFSAAETEPETSIVQGKGVLKSSPRTVTPMSTDSDISITLGNNTDAEHFMTYLKNAPSLKVHAEEVLDSGITLVTVSSGDVNKFVNYVESYPNGDVVIEYLNESLKNINSNTNFKLKVVTQE